MSVILMTTLFYKALILKGEIRCWSLLGLKGLISCIERKKNFRKAVGSNRGLAFVLLRKSAVKVCRIVKKKSVLYTNKIWILHKGRDWENDIAD